MTNTMGTTTDARPTPDLMLWLEIFETQSRYAHAIDSDDLETWPAFFTEDATYTIVSRENHDRGLPAPILHCRNRAMMRDRVVALRNANIYEEHRYRHSTSGPVILEADGDSVRTETSYIVVRTGQAGDAEVYSAGSYHDTLVRTDAGWRYRERKVIYDTSRVLTLLATPI
ncbi:anthranilate 1,2-dioxygenase small subunit AndAd [Granulicoccus phenolivorans]|uniref:anthranilate 1,2-dioxygenase small subunit AndAd n=1 Tax=Granulicoccus phenolivorans TaxID=266854 RepID=UPI00041CC80A|nr:anthranilate 1,2-dioxygenase small subunit AndAd [Granulicoccus phenolivorans]